MLHLSLFLQTLTPQKMKKILFFFFFLLPLKPQQWPHLPELLLLLLTRFSHVRLCMTP